MYSYCCGVFIESNVYKEFRLDRLLCDRAIYVFIIVLQELHCLPNRLHVCISE